MSVLAATVAMLAGAQPFLPADFLARTPVPGDRRHFNDPWNSDQAIERALKLCPVVQSLRADLRGDGHLLLAEVHQCDPLHGATAEETWESGGALVIREEARILAWAGFPSGGWIELDRILPLPRHEVLLFEVSDGGQAPARYGVLAWTHGKPALLAAPDLVRAAKAPRLKDNGCEGWVVESNGDTLHVRLWIFGYNDACAEPRHGHVDADLSPEPGSGVLRVLQARWTH